MTLVFVMSLTGCDTTSDKSVTQQVTAVESLLTDKQNIDLQPAGNPASQIRSGAHNRRDPHAELTPGKHLQVALQHLAEERTQLAMDTLGRAISLYPDNAELYGVRGSLYLEQGRSAAALADLNRAVELAPHNPAFLTNRAQVYRRFERTEEALADLDQAIELDNHFVAARFNRGTVVFSAGNYNQALTDFDACIAADPQSAAPYFNRASVHDAMGHRDLAIADLNHFMEIARSEQWKNVARALLLKWEGSDKPAVTSGPS